MRRNLANEESRLSAIPPIAAAGLICVFIAAAGLTAVFLTGCELVPEAEAPHSNINDPENPEFTGDLPEAVLSGLPASETYATTINVTVGGEGIVAYKYSLDDGTWSDESTVATAITASGLGQGAHSLLVIGKNSGGLWQWESLATTYSWTILEVTDFEPPSNINITAFSGSAHVAEPANPLSISWPLPDENVLIARGLSGQPVDSLPTDQTQYAAGETISGYLVVYAGDASEATDSIFDTDGTYYYRAYAYDDFFNYASGGTAQYVRVYKDAVYVHFDGNDMNPGFSALPLRTIQAGIAKSVELGSALDVRVAGTTTPATEYYSVYPDNLPVADMASGVSLYGGYARGSWDEASRNPETNISRLCSSGSRGSLGGKIVSFYDLDEDTGIYGFTLEGFDTTYETMPENAICALYISDCNGTITVSSCDITAGENPQDTGYTYGIYIMASEAVISGNRRIWGGVASGGGTSIGIYAVSGSTVTISGNDTGTDCIACEGSSANQYGVHISGGSGHLIETSSIRSSEAGEAATNPVGIMIEDTSAVVRNCRIESVISTGAWNEGYALYISGTAANTVTVYNCHILSNALSGTSSGITIAFFDSGASFSLYNSNLLAGPAGTGSQGFAISLTSYDTANTSVMNNNICCDQSFGTSFYGVYENDTGAIDQFGANTLFECTVLYYDSASGSLNQSGIQSLSVAANLFDEVLVFDTDGKVTSPADMDTVDFDTDGVDGAAQSPAWGFTTDKEGTARTGNGITGWSIGPYEYD